MKGEGGGETAEALHSFLATIVDSKNKTIHLRDFKDVDLNFTHLLILNLLTLKLN